ncbi:metallophosphoesterase [Pimelobacter simplex]|uniref:metallophosphoesterase n=1 Tax=Nocardioides simplex TaxID=2045 RepID=UPI003AACD0A9
MSTRHAVIGDVGGHAGALRAELARLGVPDEGRGPIPDDLVVVQVGDLVHRGPDSEEVVRQVDGYLRRQPGRWVQLIGNHEAQYVRPAAFQWPTPLDPTAADRIRAWWREGLMVPATVLPTGVLVTHAGLTRGFWREVLGAPASAGEIADALDALAQADDPALFRAGCLLQGRDPDPLAGPLWAAAASELLVSWAEAEEPAPVDQVHGHSSSYDWERGAWRLGPALAAHGYVDAEAKHVTVDLPAGGRVVGVDPDHGATPRTPWRSWPAPGTA